jgi:hypothetical protein
MALPLSGGDLEWRESDEAERSKRDEGRIRDETALAEPCLQSVGVRGGTHACERRKGEHQADLPLDVPLGFQEALEFEATEPTTPPSSAGVVEMIPRVMHAEYLGEYKIRLRFADRADPRTDTDKCWRSHLRRAMRW